MSGGALAYCYANGSTHIRWLRQRQYQYQCLVALRHELSCWLWRQCDRWRQTERGHRDNPGSTQGKVHVVNCLYDGVDYHYCIGYGVYSNIYVEKCAATTAAARENFLKIFTANRGVPANTL